jgi:DNA-binding NarL/FixJ family response regulator
LRLSATARKRLEVPVLKILIADDHDIVRKGIRGLLEDHEGWQVCAEAATGREAVRLALAHGPDVVVIDYSMPELNGIEATRQIRAALPDTEVLVFTMHDSEDVLQKALAAGARGYLVKSDDSAQLIDAVQSLSRHKAFVSTAVSGALVSGFLHGTGSSVERPLESLTAREREIVQLLAEGNSNKEIAAKLFISVKTVETHRAAVMRKLAVNSIVELVHFAIRNKLVEP